MAGSWRAYDVPSEERLYYMRHAVSELMGPIGMTYADKKEDFPGWLRATDIGALRVVHGSAPEGEFVRTPRLIRRSDPELCGLWWPNRHRWTVEQDDRQASLEPGSVAFVDMARPFRFSGRMHDFGSVLFPKALLSLTGKEIGRLAGLSLAQLPPYGTLMSTLVRQLMRDIDAYRGAGAARVGSAVLELIAGVLAATMDRPVAPQPDTGHHALLLRIRAFIQERLGDPELDPATVAAAHHISLRQLYKLFEAEGETVADWIRRQRLSRCRRDLLDPALRARPVSAIAARWGFTDAASFSRAFRRGFGIPPGEFRRLGQPAPR
jgi:AraC-like DNA-binding protein